MVSPTILLIQLLLATTALAAENCMCRDYRGDMHSLTMHCCRNQKGYGALITMMYWPGPHKQCTSPFKKIDRVEFSKCCRMMGALEDANCWK
ncbi:Protein of unknown function [Pyronema omphalodes CBS 100304]|uniref:Uncharacterized protein n=1 Tax=Pyronema omphalodes (strain CBS 100304) TaxID=1076935 RepID=U4LH35_PYROM|nr:Protein of unknown function [Pyronema omphalodes CBS 100304]